MVNEKDGLRNLVLISSTQNAAFAEKVAEYLDKPLAKKERSVFGDTDLKLRIADQESVRRKHACLIMTYEPPVAQRLHELIVWTDALMSGSLDDLTIVLPYFFGARQDRKTRRGEPINVRAYINAIRGVADDQVSKLGWMTVDLHSPQCAGLSMTFDNLSALPFFARHIRNNYDRNVVIVSPDVGGLKRAADLAGMLEVDTPTCVPKIRKQTGEIEKRGSCYEEEVISGKTAIIIDDIIGSGSTLVQAYQGLRESGAERVAVYATHVVLNSAEDNLRKINARIFTTDTIYHSPEKLKALGITAFPISYIIAEAIRRQHIGESTRELRETSAVDIIANRMPKLKELIG